MKDVYERVMKGEILNLEGIKKAVRDYFCTDFSGHDYWHTIRVYNNAVKIAHTENCNLKLVELASLLHDVDDKKLVFSDGYENAVGIMIQNGIEKDIQKEVIDIIKDVSFRGKDTVRPSTIEGKIVQDADRLDAMGAIGIARTFAYGGNKNRMMYSPDINPDLDMSGDDYLHKKGTSLNHFYEKLLCLKDMMNTDYAKQIAKKRDSYMRGYLEEFMREINEI